MRYGSAKGRSASSSGSPVEESPAACVIVPNRIFRALMDASMLQSRTNPAEGGSKATGGPAIDVQVSQTVCILDRSPVPGQPLPDLLWRALELQQNQARMIQQSCDSRP